MERPKGEEEVLIRHEEHQIEYRLSQRADTGPLRVKFKQYRFVRASQNRKDPVQILCSFHKAKVQFSSKLLSIANMCRNRLDPVRFVK